MLNRAINEIGRILYKFKPDVLCLQEIDTSDENLKKVEKHKYQLADFSNSFIRSKKIYGVTTFYNPSSCQLISSRSFNLPTNLYQVISFIMHRNRNPRTVLKNEFMVKKNGKRIAVYNIHLTPASTNSLRIKQIQNTLDDLSLDKNIATVLAGDFNYPYGRRKFELLIKKYELQEATTNINFTLERKILKKISLKLKLDYVLYKNLFVKETKRLDIKLSDHYPIYSVFELKQKSKTV